MCWTFIEVEYSQKHLILTTAELAVVVAVPCTVHATFAWYARQLSPRGGEASAPANQWNLHNVFYRKMHTYVSQCRSPIRPSSDWGSNWTSTKLANEPARLVWVVQQWLQCSQHLTVFDFGDDPGFKPVGHCCRSNAIRPFDWKCIGSSQVRGLSLRQLTCYIVFSSPMT